MHEERIGPGHYRLTHTEESVGQWNADIDAFKASRRTAPRVADPTRSDAPTGMATPLAERDERLVLRYQGGSYALFKVDGPTPLFRLVGLVKDGVAQVWELSGFTESDALTICNMFVNHGA
jgi:hypothetical protein